MLLLAGCGQDEPPYDGLPLRDALRASPEVVASLSLETRREVAQRMEQATQGDDAAMALPSPEVTTIDALSRSADEAREDRGQDALVLGEVVLQPNELVVSTAGIDEQNAYRVPAGPILLRGRPGVETAAFEDAALRGRAGQLLRELSLRTETQQLVRTTGLPMGAWAFGDTLYVNASWLVAMSALEEPLPVSPMTTGILPGTRKPGNKPLSVDFHPYNLPDSIVECANQVEANCQCGASCTHEVTDPTFTSAVEECAWVNEDPANSTALCVLALLSIDGVRACVESPGTCNSLPVTSRDDALVFVQDTLCMQFLERCLQNGDPLPQATGSVCGGCNNCNGCDCSDCSDSNSNGCQSCSDDCSQCNEDLSACNQNCKDCNQNCSDSDQNARNCGKCSVKPMVARSPLPGPIGPTFWLVAPVAYLLLRGRRRS